MIFLGPNVWVRCCLHTLIFLGPIGLRLQLAEPNGKQITSHSSIIRGAYWVKITAGKKTAAVLRRRRSRSLKPAFHGACFGAVSAPTLSARVPRRARAAFEKERFHYEHSSCFHGADCRAD